MGLTSVREVRRLGGLDDDESFRLFRMPDDAALDALIEDEIDFISAVLTDKAGSNYTQTANTNLVARFRRAEAYYVLAEITEPLKSRKTHGTHWAVDSEDSVRLEALIENNYQAKAESLVGQYLPDDTTDSPFSAGVFVIGTAVDPDDVDCITDQNAAILERATGAWCPR